jgi:hypothetical protein
VLRADDEDTVLEDHEPAPPAKPKEDEYVDSELRSLAARMDAEAAATPAPVRPVRHPSAAPPARFEFVSESDMEVAPDAVTTRATAPPMPASRAADILEPAAEPVPSPMRFVWPAAAVFALLLLAAQAIHHYRHDLATSPRFNRPLTSLYAKLGVPLVPRWDLTSYEVRQLGASTGAATKGQLLVRASLKNSASHPLPLPLLRVIVQDRYGNRIAARDVAPRAYAPGAVPEGAVLGAGQRLDTEMSFVDPGQQAVGFEIDACLPGPDNAIHCANDAVAAAAR